MLNRCNASEVTGLTILPSGPQIATKTKEKPRTQYDLYVEAEAAKFGKSVEDLPEPGRCWTGEGAAPLQDVVKRHEKDNPHLKPLYATYDPFSHPKGDEGEWEVRRTRQDRLRLVPVDL